MKTTEHKIELRFKSKIAKETFLSGLSDGFGENYCNLTWPKGYSFDDAPYVEVENADDEPDSYERPPKQTTRG